MFYALSISLSLLVVWFLSRPFFSEFLQESGSERIDLRDLSEHKERLVQVLKDHELDFETGKIDFPEHERMKSTLSLELAEILDQIDLLGKNK